MHLSTIVRYGLWIGIIRTARANHHRYHMPTTWVPHLVMNSITLLLPEIYRLYSLADVRRPASEKSPRPHWPAALQDLINTVLATIVRDDPRYVIYVTPLAAGYLVSHPQVNIYKGKLSEREFAGLGLDALPHSTTACALTLLVVRTLRVAARTTTTAPSLERLIRRGDRHSLLISVGVLTLVTLAWELGEYRVYRYELAQRGRREAINMQWSRRDMLQDCVANALGWGLAAVLLHFRKR